jgi:hypothetical protein
LKHRKTEVLLYTKEIGKICTNDVSSEIANKVGLKWNTLCELISLIYYAFMFDFKKMDQICELAGCGYEFATCVTRFGWSRGKDATVKQLYIKKNGKDSVVTELPIQPERPRIVFNDIYI